MKTQRIICAMRHVALAGTLALVLTAVTIVTAGSPVLPQGMDLEQLLRSQYRPVDDQLVQAAATGSAALVKIRLRKHTPVGASAGDHYTSTKRKKNILLVGLNYDNIIRGLLMPLKYSCAQVTDRSVSPNAPGAIRRPRWA
jgi:hypothetical protein